MLRIFVGIQYSKVMQVLDYLRSCELGPGR